MFNRISCRATRAARDLDITCYALLHRKLKSYTPQIATSKRLERPDRQRDSQSIHAHKLRLLLDWYTTAICRDISSANFQIHGDLRTAAEEHIVECCVSSNSYFLNDEANLIKCVQSARQIRQDISGETTDRALSDIRQWEEQTDAQIRNGDHEVRQIALEGLKGCVGYLNDVHRLHQAFPTSYPTEQHRNTFDTIIKLGGQLGDPALVPFESWPNFLSQMGRVNSQIISLLQEIHEENFNGWFEAVVSPTAQRIVPTMATGKCVCVVGADFAAMKRVLDSTERTGINVFSYGSMARVHGNPAFDRYAHLYGPVADLSHFPGPVLVTGNCQVPLNMSQDKLFFAPSANSNGKRVDIFRNGGGIAQFLTVANSMSGFSSRSATTNDVSIGAMEISDLVKEVQQRPSLPKTLTLVCNQNDSPTAISDSLNVVCGGDIASAVVVSHRMKNDGLKFDGKIVLGDDIRFDAKLVSCLLGLSYLEMIELVELSAESLGLSESFLRLLCA